MKRISRVQTSPPSLPSLTSPAPPVASPPLARKLPPLPNLPQKAVSAPPAKPVSAPVKPSAPVKARKPRKHVRITESDHALLEAVYRAGRITLPQLARAVESITENKRARVQALVREGYLGVDESHEMKRYWIRKKGLAAIGMADEKERNLPPAASTLAHTNKLNTILIGLSIGNYSFNDLAARETEAANRDIIARNNRWEAENTMLLRQQAELSRKPVLTAAEKRFMAKKPRSMTPLLSPEERRAFFIAEHGPKPVIPELIMLRDERMKGEVACRRDWERDTEAFLSNPDFPTRGEGEPINLTSEDRQTMEAIFQETANGNAGYLFKHWNLDGKFEKKHGWDGIIMLPHVIHADGTISGGSWAIEMEENKKPIAEIERVLEQAIDHPLLAGVIYYTDKKQINGRVKEARNSLIKKLASRDYDTRKTMNQKMSEATLIVESAVRIRKSHYINSRANAHGLWG